jgi:hypothetical protein
MASRLKAHDGTAAVSYEMKRRSLMAPDGTAAVSSATKIEGA